MGTKIFGVYREARLTYLAGFAYTLPRYLYDIINEIRGNGNRLAGWSEKIGGRHLKTKINEQNEKSKKKAMNLVKENLMKKNKIKENWKEKNEKNQTNSK